MFFSLSARQPKNAAGFVDIVDTGFPSMHLRCVLTSIGLHLFRSLIAVDTEAPFVVHIVVPYSTVPLSFSHSLLCAPLRSLRSAQHVQPLL